MKEKRNRVLSFLMASMIFASSIVPHATSLHAQDNNSVTVGNESNLRDVNSTAKIELKIGRLEGDTLVETSQEWYTQQVVDSAVDLDISGNNYTIENPYLVIKIPKTNKIKDVKTTDSQAATKTERYEDGNYQYVKYHFNRLTGGNHSTYPFYFTFDGYFATNGDSIEIEATLYASDNAVLKNIKQKYIAKTVGYEIASNHVRSGVNTVKRTERLENGKVVGHDNIIKGTIAKEGDLKTSPYIDASVRIVAMLYPKKIEGQAGDVGLEYPKNIKVVYTYPKDETNFRYVGKESQTGNEIVKIKDNVVEVIKKNPNFKDDFKSFYFEPPVPSGLRVVLTSNTKDISVKKPLPVSIEFYKNVNEDGTGGEFIGKLTDSFEIQPNVFKQGSNFEVIPKAYEAYSISREFHYIYNPQYYHLDGKIFKGNINMQDYGGVPFVSYLSQYNNGSGESPYKGGITETVDAIYNRLKEDGSYINKVQLWFRTNRFDSTEIDNVGNAIMTAINDGNTRLYGINEDGTEDLLEENIKITTVRKSTNNYNNHNDGDAWYSEYIDIGNKSKKYKEVVVRFEKPIVLDNITFLLRNRAWFTDEMFDKFKTLKGEVLSFKIETAVSKLNIKENKFEKTSYYPFNTDYFTVQSLHPSVNEYISEPQIIEYSESGTFDYKVGGVEIYTFHNDLGSTYGDLKEIKNVKTITLLPSGYEYTGKYEKINKESEWAKKPPVNEPKVSTVENFNGTGKTAIVVDYGNLQVESRYPINLKLRATKYAMRGESDFVNYMTYDDNDFIRPATEGNKNIYDYVDDLDLDGDGDLTEIFMQKHTKVTFVPPLELLLNNTVQNNSDYDTSSTGDLGQEISYKINIFNNSIKDITNLDVLDVLPDVGDHSIAPNDLGKYIERKSDFPTGLTKSLEEVNNDDVNSKVEFLYQVVKQGEDLKSVRDGEWLTKDKITDFSKVKSVKISLKKDQVLKSKEEMDIIIPSKIPFDSNLKEGSFAHNSSAFSTDGKNYTEGNVTNIDFMKYLVKGIAFYDINEDGKYDKDDVLAKGVDVILLTEDGNKATDPNGKELKVITDEKGEYSIPVYKRGSYKVSFVKGNGQEFNKISSGDESVANSIDVNTINDNVANTQDFTLLPVHKEQIKNVALIQKFGQINIIKVSDEIMENGKSKPLSGAEFILLTKDNKEVFDSDGKKIEKVITDDEGKASFSKIPYGEYKVKEVKAPKNHIIEKEVYDVNFTDKQKLDITIEIKNKKNPKISVSGEKVWDDANNQDGKRPKEVTVRLFKNGEDTNQFVKVTEDSKWKYSFDQLDTYDENGDIINYTVKEDKVESYETTIKGTTITNTHVPENIDIPVEKVWVDNNNAKNLRPDKVHISLYANNEQVADYYLTSNENWKHTFEKLPKYKEGNEINYTVREDKVSNYSTAYSGEAKTTLTITNTIEGKVSIPVTKKWIGKENKEAVIHLFADDKEVDKFTITKDTNWQHVFENLDQYKDGKEIVYKIEEDELEGYKSEISGDVTNYLVTNTNMSTKDVSLIKTWKGKEADEIEVTLLRDSEEIQNVKITKQDDWKYTFKDLEVYDKVDGHEYNYTISEKSLFGYINEIKGNQETGYEIINTYSPKSVVTNIPIKKVVTGNPKTSEIFTFKMKALNIDNPMPQESQDGVKTITINGNGETEFANIEFKLPGIYNYEITEINNELKNYEYDNSVYTIVFEVKDVKGELVVESKILKENTVEKEIVFTNIYKEPKKEQKKQKLPKTGIGSRIIKYSLFMLITSVIVAYVNFNRKNYN